MHQSPPLFSSHCKVKWSQISKSHPTFLIHCICTAFGLNITNSILGIVLRISFGWSLTFLNGGKFCLIPIIRQFSVLLLILFFFYRNQSEIFIMRTENFCQVLQNWFHHNGCPLTIYIIQEFHQFGKFVCSSITITLDTWEGSISQVWG